MKVVGWIFVVLGIIDTVISLILKSSAEVSFVNSVSRYANNGGPGFFDLMLYIGIAFLVIGIIFLIFGSAAKKSPTYTQPQGAYVPVQPTYTGQTPVMAQTAVTAQASAVNQAPLTNQAAASCKCGTPIIPGERFCRSCGNDLMAAKNSCAKCGASLAPGQKFCTECGAQQV